MMSDIETFRTNHPGQVNGIKTRYNHLSLCICFNTEPEPDPAVKVTPPTPGLRLHSVMSLEYLYWDNSLRCNDHAAASWPCCSRSRNRTLAEKWVRIEDHSVCWVVLQKAALCCSTCFLWNFPRESTTEQTHHRADRVTHYLCLCQISTSHKAMVATVLLCVQKKRSILSFRQKQHLSWRKVCSEVSQTIWCSHAVTDLGWLRNMY